MPKTTRKKPKKDDRRGKHTKESRDKLRAETRRFFDSLHRASVCIECGASDFVTTQDGDTTACTSCGLLSGNRVIDGATDVLTEFHGSAPYRCRNYFAERIRQARGLDPRFTTSRKNKINVVWTMLHDRDGKTWTNNGKSFSKHRFRQICGVLDQMEPGRRWKQMLEKWWQAREAIYGLDQVTPVLDETTSHELKVLFDPLAAYFSLKFKKDIPGSHNIPKMDLLILVLLYNISEESLQKYGWYFLSKNIIWPTESTLHDYDRIKQLAESVNEDFTKRSKKPFVRNQSYAWLNKNQYKVPPLDDLIWFAYDSTQGRIVYNQLCTYDDPLREVTVKIVD